jgi:hypothetical protein
MEKMQIQIKHSGISWFQETPTYPRYHVCNVFPSDVGIPLAHFNFTKSGRAHTTRENEMPTSTAFASATPWNSLKEKPEAAEIWWEKYRFHDPCHRGSGNHVKIEYLKIPIVISPVTSQCLGEPKVLVKAVDIGWKIEFGNYTVTILCWFNCIVQIFFVYRFPYIHKYIPNIYQYLISHYTWFLALWYCINPQLPSGKLT